MLGLPPLGRGIEIQRRLVQARAANEAKAQPKPKSTPAPLPTPLHTPVRQRAPNPHQVRVSCHLRPAIQYDMEAVAAIYNHEVVNSYKAVDTELVKAQEFRDIYSKCETENMPFAVAVEGPYVIGATSRPHIIGFALVTAVAPGIAGAYKTQSCPGGKLLVIVKPEYRRKKLGAALIDLIFDSCSGGHASRRGYQFVNPSQDQRLVGYVGNPRQWFYIDMQVMVRSLGNKKETEEGEEYKWILEWLEVKFALLLVNHEKRFFYDPRSQIWVDRLTFRHVCRAREGPIPAFHISRPPVEPSDY
jgi:GNAT superfamily N-acetyltransferase